MRAASISKTSPTCPGNKIGGILATLGVKGYRALKGDRREQLTLLRQPDGDRILDDSFSESQL